MQIKKNFRIIKTSSHRGKKGKENERRRDKTAVAGLSPAKQPPAAGGGAQRRSRVKELFLPEHSQHRPKDFRRLETRDRRPNVPLRLFPISHMVFSTEIIRPYTGGGIRCALFDFDGTISLIREGWQQIMTPYFCECIASLGTGESPAAVEAEVREFIDRLTGKQTIFQCMALDEAIVRRGGPRREPLVYKTEYLRRLAVHIADRKKGLADGTVKKEALTVKGARELLIKLRQAGVKCFLASGTDETDVKAEAALLGVDGFFDGGIRGATEALTDCSKEAVIKNMLETEGILPQELVTFGDGCVEIELTASAGGYAVGVATNEKTGEGVDEWKRRRLLAAGASMILPNFERPDDVLKALGL